MVWIRRIEGMEGMEAVLGVCAGGAKWGGVRKSICLTVIEYFKNSHARLRES